MTRTQAKATIKKLLESGSIGKLFGFLCESIEDVESLISDVEETKYNIEPYEGKEDLTEQQQERYDWFDDLQGCLEELKDCMEDLQYKINELEDRE